MVSRLSRRRAGAWLAVVAAIVTAGVLGLVIPASSAAPGSLTAAVAHATAAAPPAAVAAVAPAAAAHRRSVLMLRTLVRGLHVRSLPNFHSRMTSLLGVRGTRVTIKCWATGAPVAGNPIWYHISGPRRGYVSSYYISTRTAPHPGVARCKTPFPRLGKLP